MKNKRFEKKSLTYGIASSLVASLCCITPLVVALLGIGSFSIALSFLRYRPYFLVLGLIFLSGAIYLHIKRDYGKCNLHSINKAKYFILSSFAIMTVTYIGITYFLIPPILISSVQNTLKSNQLAHQAAAEIKVKINGMTCECNIADIQYNLMQINGVLNASIDYTSKIGTIKFDSAKTNQYAILKSDIFNGPYSAKLIN